MPQAGKLYISPKKMRQGEKNYRKGDCLLYVTLALSCSMR